MKHDQTNQIVSGLFGYSSQAIFVGLQSGNVDLRLGLKLCRSGILSVSEWNSIVRNTTQFYPFSIIVIY